MSLNSEASPSFFGSDLRSWRRRRSLSQLELGLDAGVSARHISFLETGRSRPSRDMVLRLAAALDLPLREQNALLVQAGFAPRYARRGLDHPETEEALGALRFILDAHEPNPAFVLDRHWDIVLWNRTQEILIPELASCAVSAKKINALDLVFVPGMGREGFVNWEEVARAVLRRLRRQAARVSENDPLMIKLKEIQELPGVADLDLHGDADRAPPVLVPMKIRNGDEVFTWFSTLAVFGASGDVTLDELVIEVFFPGDATTRAYLSRIV